MKLYLISVLLLLVVGCNHNKRSVPVVQTVALPLAEPGYRLTGQTSAKACRPNFLTSGFYQFDHFNSGALKDNSIFPEKSPVEYEISANENPELLALNEKIKRDKSVASSDFNPVVLFADVYIAFFNGILYATGQDQVSYAGSPRKITAEEAETVSVEFPQNKNQNKVNFSKNFGVENILNYDQMNNFGIYTVAKVAYHDAIAKINADYIIDGTVDVESTTRIPGIIIANDYCVTVSGTGIVLTGPSSRKK